MTNTNYNHPTAIELCIDGADVSIKAKQDESVYGWAVIVFTESCSLRSNKLHKPTNLNNFIYAILEAMSIGQDEENYAVILKTINTVTGH